MGFPKEGTFSSGLNKIIRKPDRQPICGLFHNLPSRLVVHQPALAPLVLRVGLLQVAGRTLHAAAAAGGEDVEHLAAEVVGLDEGVDDGGCSVPPDGEADPDGVVEA